MCRIAGVVSLRRREFSSDLRLMLTSQAHGGPDDEGIYIDGAVAFGHRRLSIIDLSSAGHQPMLTPDSQLAITFNGEIYNYRQLRRELQEAGAVFKTESDTEVILRAYEQWGVNSFPRFEGIFAFSLYDKKSDTIHLVRDHIGVKPLYYSIDNQELVFASEVRAFTALRRDWPENPEWKILFLAFGSLPHPATTLQGVYQLPAGSYLSLRISTFQHTLTFYYQPGIIKHTLNTEPEALDIIRKATEDALHKNLISDAPIGIFLSGGIDSSLLTLLADKTESKVKTISVNFEDAAYDERPFQDIVLKNTTHVNHVVYMLSEQMFWDNLDDIWRAMDQPSIDGVNAYFVSLCAKREGLKVVLSGLGADEIFGGYKSTHRIRWVKRLRRYVPFKRMLAKVLGLGSAAFKRLMFLSIPGAVGDYLFLRGIYTPEIIAQLLNIPEEKVWTVLNKISVNVPEGMDEKEYVSFLESKIYMSNQLLKDTDYMGMWHGLEVRVPFLDIDLIAKTQSVAPAIRYKEHWPKYLLTAPYKELLPFEIVFRKKTGFTFPFSQWMKNSPQRFQAMVPKDKPSAQVVKEFEHNKIHWSKYWSLVVFEHFK